MRVRSWLACALLAAGGASAANAQQVRAMWGSGPGDIWAIIGQAAILHHDGRVWSRTPLAGMGTPIAIWGSGPRDVFVVGERGLALRWDGARWTRLATGVTRDLVAVGGRSATEVYVLAQAENDTDRPLLLRWDGRQFTPTPLQIPFRVHALAVGAAGILVAGVAHFDPTPNERRSYGVVATETRGAWRFHGFDGRQVTDAAIAGATWGRVCVTATSTTIAGNREDGSQVVMVQGRTGAWTPVTPPVLPANARADEPTWLFTGDCTRVFLFEQGFARYTGREWQVVAPELTAAAQGAVPTQELEALARRIEADVQAGRMPSQAQLMRLQQLQVAASGQVSAQMAAVSAAQDFAFGESPSGWGMTGSDFWVGTGEGRMMHVTGDSSRVAFHESCLQPQAAGLSQCQGIRVTTTPPPADPLPQPARPAGKGRP